MASKYNIKLDQGSDYDLSITYKDPSGNSINLAGYTARMDVRVTYSTPSTIIELTTENGMISIDSANGTINLSIDAANTANLPISNAVYDLELVSGSSVNRLIEGKFVVNPEVTR
jgi:thiamine pyrophosphokinase